MTGAGPMPANFRESFLGAIIHLMWELHHQVALESPELGEMVAFRKVVDSIPRESAVDEASLEAAVRGAGFELLSVPEAVVLNKEPESVRDFLVQRRRTHAGHLWLRENSSYQVSTAGVMRVARYLVKVTPRSGKGLLMAATSILLEGLGRALGWVDFVILKRNPFVWQVAESTKKPGHQARARLR